eukprot:8837864-Pyramimonas_sp.AAC.1
MLARFDTFFKRAAAIGRAIDLCVDDITLSIPGPVHRLYEDSLKGYWIAGPRLGWPGPPGG